jgi:lactoylglutathione lyase
MITRIATVAVYVEDQDKAEEFWTRQVGFGVKKETKWGRKRPGWKSARAAGQRIW